MAPSTENTDQLLEWHPGANGAATINPLAALAWGAGRAWSSKLLVCYLWLVHLLVFEGAGSAIMASLRASTNWAATARSLVVESASGSLLLGQSADTGYRALLIDSMARPLWNPTTHFVLFFGLIAGGAIAYLHAPRPAPVLAQLGAGCGTYVGRFMRLILIAALVFWLLTVIASAVLGPNVAGLPTWARVGLFQATIAFCAATMDYARVRTVARDSRSMLLETLRSVQFVVRNLPRILALEVLVVALTFGAAAAPMAAANALSGFVPAEHVAFCAEQIYVIAMLWVRLVTWGAMLALYQGISLERLSKTGT